IMLINGAVETITADAMAYDEMGHLMFLNVKQGIQTPKNPTGQGTELVKCYNPRNYISYGLAVKKVQH
ncbi:MAG: hypothetical protein LRY76_07510, partial [Alphaproteobacteria bacterium]|nr:hypothetical protein [Alphaproteobacteria bacterium]